MLKTATPIILGIFALCLSHAVSADPTPAANAPRVLVMLQVVQVPSTMPISVSDTHPASELYKTLLQMPGAEATEISVQTTAGFPAEARYNRVLTFSTQDHGKPTRGFLDVPTSLEATPHINPDGTITVQLKTEVTRVAPAIGDEVPLTNGDFWQSKQTFKNGETRMFGVGPEFTSMRGLVGSDPKTLARNKELAASQNKLLVPFVTVTVLPGEKIAQR